MVSRRVRIVIWLAAIAAVAAIVVSGTIAFVVLRTIESREATAATAAQAFNQIRSQHPGRPPMIEIENAKLGHVKINRAPNAPRKPVDTIYFMYWNPDDQKLSSGMAPTWITNFRLSLTGFGNVSFSDLHITREDIERYSPGILIDFRGPDGTQVLAWTR